MLRYSALETDRGECPVSVGLYRGGRTFHYRRLRTDIVWFVFRRCCHYRGDSGSYVTGISDAEFNKDRTEIRLAD